MKAIFKKREEQGLYEAVDVDSAKDNHKHDRCTKNNWYKGRRLMLS